MKGYPCVMSQRYLSVVKMVLFLTSVGAILSACRKSESTDAVIAASFVDSVKIWYNSSFPKEQLRGSVNWGQAVEVVRENGKRYLEVPIAFKKPVRERIRKEAGVRRSFSEQELQTYSNLLIHQDATGRFRYFIMKVIEDDPQRDNSSPVSYGKLPSDFSGLIYYTAVNGGIYSGYKVSDGKVTHKVNLSTVKPKGNERLDCTTITIDIYQQVCWDNDTKCTEWEYKGSTSSTTCVYTPEASDQPYTEEDPPNCYECGDVYYVYYTEEQEVEEVEVKIDTVITLIENDCIETVLNQVTDARLKNIIARFFTKTFVETGTRITLNISDVDSILGSSGQSIPATSTFNGKNVWNIKVSRQWADASSNEYMATVLMHELVHSFLVFYRKVGDPPMTEIQSHEVMLNTWVTVMRDALIEIYGMTSKNATALALQGVDDVVVESIDANEQIVWKQKYNTFAQTKYNLSLTEAYEIVIDFANAIQGSKCQ